MCEFNCEIKVVIAAKIKNSDHFQYVCIRRYETHYEFQLTDSIELAYLFCDSELADAVAFELRLADDRFYYGDLRIVPF